MVDRTGIEWTDATWNPVTGCTKVSQGCKHCYAERDWSRLAHLPAYQGRAFTDVECHPKRLHQPLHCRVMPATTTTTEKHDANDVLDWCKTDWRQQGNAVSIRERTVGAPRRVEDFNLTAPATVLLAAAIQAASRYVVRPEYSLARSMRHNAK